MYSNYHLGIISIADIILKDQKKINPDICICRCSQLLIIDHQSLKKHGAKHLNTKCMYIYIYLRLINGELKLTFSLNSQKPTYLKKKNSPCVNLVAHKGTCKMFFCYDL